MDNEVLKIWHEKLDVQWNGEEFGFSSGPLGHPFAKRWMLRCECCNGVLGLVPALWDLQLRPCSSPYHLKPEHRDNGEGWAESNMSVRELQQQPRDWNRTISNLERLVPYMCAELLPSNILEWHHSPAASLRSHMAYSNNYKWKILGKWFQKIPKSITWTCHHGGTICIVFTFYNYLHSIYII